MKRTLSCLAMLAAFILTFTLTACAAGYGSSREASALSAVLEGASGLIPASELYFTPDTELLPESTVQYYSDESILVVAWQKPVGNTVYNYFEICVADASQFGRYTPGRVAAGGDWKTVEEMSADLGAILVSSGDFYGLRGISVVVNDGEVFRADSQLKLDLCMVDYNGDLHCLRAGYFASGEEIQPWVTKNNINFCLEFGPVLYENGERQEIPSEYIMGQNKEEFTRSALCQLGPLHYLIVTANFQGYYWQSPTLDAFADVLGDTGCITAYALDGGQTASVAMNGRLVNRVNYGGMRAVSDGIFFTSAAG